MALRLLPGGIRVGHVLLDLRLLVLLDPHGDIIAHEVASDPIRRGHRDGSTLSSRSRLISCLRTCVSLGVSTKRHIDGCNYLTVFIVIGLNNKSNYNTANNTYLRRLSVHQSSPLIV